MSYPINMRLRKTGEIVTVYNIFKNSTDKRIYAIIWYQSDAGNRNGKGHGNGWSTILAKGLIPIDYSASNGEFVSKTRLNKEKVTLVSAIFECSDGVRFTSDGSSVEEASTQAKLHELLIHEEENKC